MKRRQWLTALAVTALLIGGGYLGLLGLGEMLFGSLRRKYQDRPPAEGFRSVFQQAPPPGVTDVRATGESWLGGTNIWLVFHADLGTLRKLIRSCGGKGGSNALSPREPDQPWDAEQRRYDPQDHLGWARLGAIRKLRVWHWESGLEITVWFDQETETAFVFCFGT